MRRPTNILELDENMNIKKQYLKECAQYIPSCSQTLSKNPNQYVIGVTPVAVARANGCYFWDMEGKKYLDMVLALGPMILGYANKRIDRMVKKQIESGTIFSLPSPKELELARLLKEVVPCAEMSRFLMNGNEATTGAVRLARYITGRNHIAKCGYHGFQDWSICNKEGRNSGVPALIKTLTHDFVYNNVASLEKIFNDYHSQIAAVIMEPVSSDKPQGRFLEKVKAAAHKNGAILIFDEMITGFRWALGGAQEYFNVVPDLACFGKAVANGYPISIIAGKAEFMKRMDEIFVSTTFGGFVPSVVASIETIKVMKEFGDVQQHLHQMGDYLIKEGNRICFEDRLPVKFVGYGPHPVMKINIPDDYEARVWKTFIYQEMNKAGILFNSSIMMSYSHKKEQINLILQEFSKIAKKLSTIGKVKGLEKLLKGEVVAPRTVRAV